MATERRTAEQIAAACDTAHRILVEAVNRQWDGRPAFHISIPANPTHDTDIIISEALTEAAARLREQEQRLKELGASHDRAMQYYTPSWEHP